VTVREYTVLVWQQATQVNSVWPFLRGNEHRRKLERKHGVNWCLARG